VYARSTTLMARPESLDAGIAHVRDEVMPEIEQMEGCVGLSMLVNRQSGRCVTTSAWQSEETMRASESRIQAIRERLAQAMGGSSPQVQEWEIAVLHRDHQSPQGACVRATWVRADPANIDRAIDVYKETSLPRTMELEGFCSVSLLVDRSTGDAVSSVTYDSMAAIARSRDAAEQMRSAASGEAGVEIIDVEEFELAVAHLRVPEMA
jgi:heme-degrading monooxygenase HmoA